MWKSVEIPSLGLEQRNHNKPQFSVEANGKKGDIRSLLDDCNGLAHSDCIWAPYLDNKFHIYCAARKHQWVTPLLTLFGITSTNIGKEEHPCSHTFRSAPLCLAMQAMQKIHLAALTGSYVQLYLYLANSQYCKIFIKIRVQYSELFLIFGQLGAKTHTNQCQDSEYFKNRQVNPTYLSWRKNRKQVQVISHDYPTYL